MIIMLRFHQKHCSFDNHEESSYLSFPESINFERVVQIYILIASACPSKMVSKPKAMELTRISESHHMTVLHTLLNEFLLKIYVLIHFRPKNIVTLSY